MSNILINVLFIILYIYNLYYQLLYLQESHYYLSRYKKHIISYYKKNIFLIILLLFYYIDIYLLLVFLILHLLYKLIHHDKVIIKLKFTNRMFRIIFVNSLIYILFNILFTNILTQIVLHTLLPFNITISIMLLSYVEKRIFKKYYNQALEKIKSNKTFKTIMITGSCGKTTVKNIIYHLIKDNYYVLKTPKSYNTINGIVKFINEEFNNNVDILIIEAGACKKGDIDEICKLIKPNIGVITELTEQHLESFKTLDNLINTKLEIINYIKDNDYLIYNSDNIYLKNKLNDYNFIKVTKENTTIIKMLPYLEFKHLDKTYITPLLGKHQIINILLSLNVITTLEKYGYKFDDEKIIYDLQTLSYIENRLEYKKLHNIDLYNDSYNSNRIGFLNAVELLSYSEYKKVIITPGLVELGSCKRIINEEIAYEISKVFDEIYIIRSEVSKYYINIFNKLNIKYHIFDSFRCCYKYILDNNFEQISLLIENDISDIYKER